MSNKIKKQSKRQPARLRYKIEKKVRDHNRKLKRDAKKNAKHKKPALVKIPNACPFKEDLLKDVAATRLKMKEVNMQQILQRAEADKLKSIVDQAQIREKAFSESGPSESKKRGKTSYYQEFKKLVEAADVILEVVDARDPLGTRCSVVERTVKDSPGNKKLVVILNKADLIPVTVLNKWLKHLRKSVTALPFKASTQSQTRNLGQRKFFKNDNTEKLLQGSSCVGSELLMSLLSNYSRNEGLKTSIKVGVAGLPNVGKSSIINSLIRNKACNVGALPGITKNIQEIELTSKIKLIDSPGIVFTESSNDTACLLNAVAVSSVKDPVGVADTILRRLSKEQAIKMYDITEYNSPQEFYSLKAARMGKFKRGGVPDSVAAARSLIQDWISGKIKYYAEPPEDTEASAHISASIVSQPEKEFDINDYVAMETDVLDQLEKCGDVADNFLTVESSGPVEEAMETDEPKGKKVKIVVQATNRNKKSRKL